MLTNIITNHFLFVALLTAALTLLFIEIVVPSFGLLGITGLYLLVESVLAMRNFQNPWGLVLASILFAIVISLIVIRTLLKNIQNNKLVLNSSLQKAKGNKPSNITADLLNRTGRVVKVLRPSGEIEIDGVVYGAISDGNFIDRGETVVVQSTEGSQLLVKRDIRI